MPKHFLFISLPDHGHLLPPLVVAKELARRGHQVDLVTSPKLADIVEANGLRPLCYESVLEAMPVEAHQEDAPDQAAKPILSVEDNAAVVDVVEEAFGDRRPDLVAYDFASSTAGRILARKWDVPAVQLNAVFAQNEEFAYTQSFDDNGVATGKPMTPRELASLPAFRPWADRTAALLDQHGMGSMFDEIVDAAAEFNLVFIPKALQPMADSFDERFAFVGPCVDDRESLGRWEPRSNGLPIVLVSLGTLFNQNPDFFRTCVEAFSDAPVHVVMTLGGGVDPAELGELPPNIEAHPWLSHMMVLKHAAVMVTHGGVSSVTDALSVGCPLVVVPVEPVTRAAGLQIDKLGLGRMLPEQSFNAEELRRTVLALIEDVTMEPNLRWMRQQIEKAGGAPRAADVLEARIQRGGG